MNYHFAAGRLDDACDLVERWHYSRRAPANVQFVATAHEPGGLFGDLGAACAACTFSIPGTRWSEDVWELSRLVRRDDAAISLTSLIAWACRWIHKQDQQNLLVSFADWTHHHHGGIYQAASWKYHGMRKAACDGVIFAGKFVPGRTAVGLFGTRSVSKLRDQGYEAQNHYDEGKHLYWRALGRSGVVKAQRLELNDLPYPKPEAVAMS